MSIKGVEQIMPKVDHMGRIQRIADEGTAAERFVLQLNQQIQAKRQSVPKTTKSAENRVDNPDRHDKKRHRPPKQQKPGSPAKKDQETDVSIPGRGGQLDVRT